MMLGGAPLGSVALGSILQDPGAIENPRARHPFTLELNGVDRTDWFDRETLEKDDTLGQSVTCRFRLVNPTTVPRPGDRVRVLYHSAVEFAGLIDQTQRTANSRHTRTHYDCTAKDWSVLLMRRRIRRNFMNLPVINIVDSIIENEAAGEGLTIGHIDQGATLPLVDVKNARCFDVLRDVGGATGQAMYVDFDKAIQYRSTTNETAPKALDDSTVEAASVDEDFETYRNVQTVIVTGTPASQNDKANVVTRTVINADQIAARQAIEGGTGRVEEIEEVTHPTSNLTADLALLAIGYANLRLAVSGTLRKTLRARVRGYGFRAGQFVPVNLPGEGVSGTWLIQRASIGVQVSRELVFQLELTQSSRQQRAYEAWLGIVKAGKITVQIPSAITNNLATFNTPGTTTWTVPAGVTILELVASGAGGGPGGWFAVSGSGYFIAGGKGGNGGYAVSTLSVTAGDELTIVIGAAGLEGTDFDLNTDPFPPQHGTDGTDGTVTYVMHRGLIVCQGNAGGGGHYSSFVSGQPVLGAPGTDGAGIGDAITVGGGGIGSTNDVPYVRIAPASADGRVEVRW